MGVDYLLLGHLYLDGFVLTIYTRFFPTSHGGQST